MRLPSRLLVIAVLLIVVSGCDLVSGNRPTASPGSGSGAPASAGPTASGSVVGPSAATVAPASNSDPPAATTAPASSAPPASLAPVPSTMPPAGSPSAQPSPSPSPSPSASPPPSAAPIAVVPPSAARLAISAWFQFTQAREGQGTEGPANPTGDTLIDFKSGTLAGVLTARIHLRRPAPTPPTEVGAIPFAEGPFGRYGVYGFTDATGSELHRVDLLTGIDSTVLRDTRVIHRAVYDPIANTYYLALLDATKRTDLGIWRFAPTTEAAPVRLEAPTGLPKAGPGPYRRLYLTPDRTRLVVVDCAGLDFDRACRARVVDAATGRASVVADGLGLEAIGVTDSWFVTPLEAIDLRTGERHPLPAMCGVATLTTVGADDMLVFESAGPACNRTLYEITSLDLDTGATRVIWSKRDFNTDQDQALMPLEEHALVPAGWVVLTVGNFIGYSTSTTPPPVLLAVESGATAPLPPWPTDPTASAPVQPAGGATTPVLQAFLDRAAWAGTSGNLSVIGNLGGSWRTVNLPVDQGGILASGNRLVTQGANSAFDSWIGEVDASTGAIRRWDLPGAMRPTALTPARGDRLEFAAAADTQGNDAGLWELQETRSLFSKVGPNAPEGFRFGSVLASASGALVLGNACNTGTDSDFNDICFSSIVRSRGCRPEQLPDLLTIAVDECLLIARHRNAVVPGPWLAVDRAAETHRTLATRFISIARDAEVIRPGLVLLAGFDAVRTRYRIVVVNLRTHVERLVLSQPVNAALHTLDTRAVSARYALLDHDGQVDAVLDLQTGRVLSDVVRAGPGS